MVPLIEQEVTDFRVTGRGQQKIINLYANVVLEVEDTCMDKGGLGMWWRAMLP